MNIEEFIEGFSFNACDNADRVIYVGHLRVLMEGKVLVPVELLKEIQVYLNSNRLSNQIRAIIDKEPT